MNGPQLGLPPPSPWEPPPGPHGFAKDMADLAELRQVMVDVEARDDRLRRLLVEADSLCSLILYRESTGLTPRTKRELDDLIRRIRAEYNGPAQSFLGKEA